MKKTNLKLFIWLGALFVGLYLVLVVFIYDKTRDYAISQSEKKIENLLLMHKAIHGYVEETQKPTIYALKNDGKLYEEYFSPELMSFTFIARGIKDEYNKQREKKDYLPIYFKLASDNPRNPINQADAREIEILKNVNDKNTTEIKEVIEDNGGKYLNVTIPVEKNKESCMRCHSAPDKAPKELVDRYGDRAGFYETIGKIRAVISIKAPLKDELREADILFNILLISLFLAMVIIYATVIYVFSKLSQKEAIISMQNEELRALNSSLEERVQAEIASSLEKEKLLIRQSKMATMGEMIEVIAHQWRQPLNALSLTIQDIGEAYKYNELDEKYIAKFKQNSLNIIEQMSKTIDDFRNFFSRSKNDDKFFIENAIEEVLTIIMPSFKKASIIVNFKYDIKTEFIGIKNELKQVLLNILVNAKDAIIEQALDNKFINIDVSLVSGVIRITIEDSAGGIADELKTQIFDAYFTTKSEDRGTGIGLYMSKEIINNSFKGTISVDNTSNGAMFTINLPTNLCI